jgi:hypothetical protein
MDAAPVHTIIIEAEVCRNSNRVEIGLLQKGYSSTLRVTTFREGVKTATPFTSSR